MATIGGYNVVTDGLVLSLDAANRRSYVSGSGTWFDVSGNRNSGSFVNGPTFNSGNGGSIVFDGVDDYVNCQNNSSVKITNNISVFCWVKANSQDNKQIVSKYKTNLDQRSWLIGTSNSSYGVGIDKLNVIISSDGTISPGFHKVYNSTNIVFNSDWVYVGFVFQSNALNLYSNGNQLDVTKTADGTVTSLYDSSSNVYIGSISNPANYLTGNISLVQIYNRALSAAEILQNYNATKSRFGL